MISLNENPLNNTNGFTTHDQLEIKIAAFNFLLIHFKSFQRVTIIPTRTMLLCVSNFFDYRNKIHSRRARNEDKIFFQYSKSFGNQKRIGSFYLSTRIHFFFFLFYFQTES